jgi:hypothetical protein
MLQKQQSVDLWKKNSNGAKDAMAGFYILHSGQMK